MIISRESPLNCVFVNWQVITNTRYRHFYKSPKLCRSIESIEILSRMYQNGTLDRMRKSHNYIKKSRLSVHMIVGSLHTLLACSAYKIPATCAKICKGKSIIRTIHYKKLFHQKLWDIVSEVQWAGNWNAASRNNVLQQISNGKPIEDGLLIKVISRSNTYAENFWTKVSQGVNG